MQSKTNKLPEDSRKGDRDQRPAEQMLGCWFLLWWYRSLWYRSIQVDPKLIQITNTNTNQYRLPWYCLISAGTESIQIITNWYKLMQIKPNSWTHRANQSQIDTEHGNVDQQWFRSRGGWLTWGNMINLRMIEFVPTWCRTYSININNLIVRHVLKE